MCLPLPERVFKKTMSPDWMPEPVGTVVVSALVVDALPVVDALSVVEALAVVAAVVGTGVFVGIAVVEATASVLVVQTGHDPQLFSHTSN